MMNNPYYILVEIIYQGKSAPYCAKWCRKLYVKMAFFVKYFSEGYIDPYKKEN